jgi:hypothetical protein
VESLEGRGKAALAHQIFNDLSSELFQDAAVYLSISTSTLAAKVQVE